MRPPAGNLFSILHPVPATSSNKRCATLFRHRNNDAILQLLGVPVDLLSLHAR